MRDRTRFFICVLVSTMAAFWLNACAVGLVIAGSGGPAQGLLAGVVHLAYLPSQLLGLPQEQWFYPSLQGPSTFNVGVWAAVGAIVAGVGMGLKGKR
jgi:hypothetical protein